MRKQEHIGCSCGACRRGRSSQWGKEELRRINRVIRHHYNDALRAVTQGADPDVDYFVGATNYTD